MGARFSAPVQTGPGAHQASCKMGTGSFPGVKIGWGVTLTPHPLLVPWSRKGRAIPLLPLWAVRPVQSLSACTRVHFYLRLRVAWPSWARLGSAPYFLPLSQNRQLAEHVLRSCHQNTSSSDEYHPAVSLFCNWWSQEVLCSLLYVVATIWDRILILRLVRTATAINLKAKISFQILPEIFLPRLSICAIGLQMSYFPRLPCINPSVRMVI